MSVSTKTISEITFAVWSPREIRKYSVCEITQPETYDEDGMAVQGGLMDPPESDVADLRECWKQAVSESILL